MANCRMGACPRAVGYASGCNAVHVRGKLDAKRLRGRRCIVWRAWPRNRTGRPFGSKPIDPRPHSSCRRWRILVALGRTGRGRLHELGKLAGELAWKASRAIAAHDFREVMDFPQTVLKHPR